MATVIGRDTGGQVQATTDTAAGQAETVSTCRRRDQVESQTLQTASGTLAR